MAVGTYKEFRPTGKGEIRLWLWMGLSPCHQKIVRPDKRSNPAVRYLYYSATLVFYPSVGESISRSVCMGARGWPCMVSPLVVRCAWSAAPRHWHNSPCLMLAPNACVPCLVVVCLQSSGCRARTSESMVFGLSIIALIPSIDSNL